MYLKLTITRSSKAIISKKISRGPKKLMDGRIDIRTLSTNISKRHISAWAAKGCLKIKNNIYSPCLFTWQEVYKDRKNFKFF